MNEKQEVLFIKFYINIKRIRKTGKSTLYIRWISYHIDVKLKQLPNLNAKDINKKNINTN